MSPDRLIYMANQIGKFFHSQGHDKAVPGIAEHIRKFWDPRMRSAIFAHLDAGGASLDPDVREALTTLKDAEAKLKVCSRPRGMCLSACLTDVPNWHATHGLKRPPAQAARSRFPVLRSINPRPPVPAELRILRCARKY